MHLFAGTRPPHAASFLYRASEATYVPACRWQSSTLPANTNRPTRTRVSCLSQVAVARLVRAAEAASAQMEMASWRGADVENRSRWGQATLYREVVGSEHEDAVCSATAGSQQLGVRCSRWLPRALCHHMTVSCVRGTRN